MIDAEFWTDRFHRCALLAGFVAHAEGRLTESEYVRRLAYDLYEGGAFHAASESDHSQRTLARKDEL